jgi:multicomponent Na+:H+ antiporter subunit F
MITALMVCFAGVFAIVSEQEAFLDVAIALALIGFLGTVAFARYAERQHELTGNGANEEGQQRD